MSSEPGISVAVFSNADNAAVPYHVVRKMCAVVIDF